MSKYTINSTNSKTFILSDENKEIGTLIQTNWFSTKFSFSIFDKNYSINPIGFFKRNIEIRNEQTLFYTIKSGMFGKLSIHKEGDSSDSVLYFKRKSFLSNSYIVQNNSQEILAIITPHFVWKKFRYDFEINTMNELESDLNKNMILFLTLYCNLLMIRRAAIAAA